METDKFIALSEMSEEDRRLIRSQLGIILVSKYFNSAKQMQRFLEYVVDKTLSGHGNLLKQFTIGVEALEFPIDFDSDNNPAVRIMGGRVRKRLKEYYENTDNNKIFIDIPKGAYTPEFSYSNNEDEKLQAPDDDQDASSDAFISSGPRLALLSFSDVTQNDMSNRLLSQTADALAEELSRFVLFKLFVHNPYADKSLSQTIREDLEADYLLALFVQELPYKQYELICRFSRVDSKEILWSESFNLESKIAIANQHDIISKITADIADIHQGKLHQHWARGLLINKETIPLDFKVLAYYRQYYDNLNVKTFAEALPIFEEALAKNPNDIIANILLSDLCRRDFVHAYDLIDSSLQRGIQCAERAAHLRPDSIEAHFTLGQLLFSQGEWDRCEDQLKIARELSGSHVVVEYGCGYYLCLMGKWGEGLLLVKKAMSISNTYPSWYHMPIFLYLYNQGKYKEALVEAKKIVAPNIPHGPLARCISYAQLGDIVRAKSEFNEVIKRMPDMETYGKKKVHRLFGNKGGLAEKICNGASKIR